MEKKTARKKLGVAPNVKNAAAVMGYPAEMFRESMTEGCRAIKPNGRVDMDEFSVWILANKPFLDRWEDRGAIPSREQSQRVKSHYEGVLVKLRADEKMRKSILRTERLAQHQTFCEEIKAAIKAEVQDRETFARICVRIQKAANVFLPTLSE